MLKKFVGEIHCNILVIILLLLETKCPTTEIKINLGQALFFISQSDRIAFAVAPPLRHWRSNRNNADTYRWVPPTHCSLRRDMQSIIKIWFWFEFHGWGICIGLVRNRIFCITWWIPGYMLGYIVLSCWWNDVSRVLRSVKEVTSSRNNTITIQDVAV